MFVVFLLLILCNFARVMRRQTREIQNIPLAELCPCSFPQIIQLKQKALKDYNNNLNL